MKSIQSSGPYYILGYSFGAAIAFEIARLLEVGGDKVAHMVLLDGSHSYNQLYKA